MKFFAFFVLMMIVVVQAFALPAVPAPGPGPLGPESAAALPSGAPKAKRDLYYYTPLVPTVKYYYPTYYYYNPYEIIV